MQDRIALFTRSLQNIATEYSDPTVILQHMPVIKDHLDKIEPLIEYKEFVLAALVGLFILRRVRKKRKKAAETKTAMVMPPPYYGEDSTLGDEHPLNADGNSGKLSLRKSKRTGKSQKPETASAKSSLDALANMVSPRQTAAQSPAAPQKRSAEDQLQDVSSVSFLPRPALSADEARMRVIVQAAINEMKAPLMIMARTSLNALVEPGRELVGPERANALAAIDGKCIDFGLFDRAGRMVLALDIQQARTASSSAATDRAIVAAVLKGAGIAALTIHPEDGPSELAARIAPLVGAHVGQQTSRTSHIDHTARTQPAGRNERPDRHVRPPRPGRPARPPSGAAIAAE